MENLKSSCFVYKSVFMYQMSVHVSSLYQMSVHVYLYLYYHCTKWVYMCIFVSALYQMSVHVYLCISTVPNECTTCVSLYQHCTKWVYMCFSFLGLFPPQRSDLIVVRGWQQYCMQYWLTDLTFTLVMHLGIMCV